MIDFDEVALKLAKAEADNKVLQMELIRTRKALDVAINAMKSAQQYICSDKKSYQIIQTAIEQITALEQKESEFVHNKIKFPEFNDNLLEEFDKQFFENGQDDDLTETALEQKE